MIDLAHGVGRVYESPLPVWLYGVAAAATVLVSFFLRAVVRSAPRAQEPRTLVGESGARVIRAVLTATGLVGLFLMILSGLVVQDRGLSLAPLMFWIGLVIGTSALCAVASGVWQASNPWATIETFYRFEEPEPRSAPPWWIGPLLLYALFWFELVSGVGFDALAIVLVLLGYTLFVFTFRSRWGPA